MDIAHVTRVGFNPRARVGRDAILVDDGHANSSFNPRARVGRDCRLLLDRYRSQTVSIHAPAWGATWL